MKNITGVMIYYNLVCKRKLWYFLKEVTLEHNSDLVGIGKLLDESSYSREKKHILIDETINVDFLKNWEVIHEVKKSRKIEVASVWQVKYYIWYLQERGVDIKKAVLDYPLLRVREDVFLTDEDASRIKAILVEIESINGLKSPPKVAEKKACKKCAYFDLCAV
ncbi:CRISPR-associated protein Cas4 [Fusibacter ferrireducens]|uniref:CRISPR-associated protein Cas4 n=1 Tax=Fusibacter ferrireducens TaxID=2785058 RepID=A0ABR9ZU48_9FIRM|nr:CRISPR-associated protein Cas4 [Fusibacter ferrireducens]MBF4693997.1 CRISPR-associated protein Cas4 [Fusibacter ferrireducens]